MDREIRGLHHITAITSDASTQVQFYTKLLGLRLVKKTVNFDDPTAYHLYFGDDEGRPGTILTFFDWGDGIERGRIGTGVAQHLAFTTKGEDSLSEWKTHLEMYNIPVQGPFDRKTFRSLYLRDPDGLIIEIATRGNGKGYADSPDPESSLFQWENQPYRLAEGRGGAVPVTSKMSLSGLHHVTGIATDWTRTETFYKDLLRLERVETGTKLASIFGRNNGPPGTMISFLNTPEAARGTVGIGTVHHIAFAVDDDEAQLKWRKRLLGEETNVTQVLDRKYFKSIYFREPNGLLLEIATIPPGFMVDETKEQLGTSLTLPKWLEPQRSSIQSSLKPIAES